MATTLDKKESGGGILSAITQLAPIFLGSGGSTATQTTSPKLTQAGMDAALKKILESNQGLAAVAGGQRSSGLYNSTVNQQLINDLITRSSAEVAMAGTPQTTTTVNSGTAPLINPGAAIGGLLLAQAFSKEGLGGIFGGSGSTAPATSGTSSGGSSGPLTGVVDKTKELFGSIFGGAADAAPAAAAVASIAPAAASMGAAGSISLPTLGLGEVTDFVNNLGVSTGGLNLSQDSIGQALPATTLGRTFGSLEGVGAGQGFDLMGTGNGVDLGGLPFGAIADFAGGNIEGGITGLLGSGVGAAVNAIIPGLGFLVGPLFGAAESSVICTELHRSGLMPSYLYRLDVQYAHSYMSKTTLRGYRWWAVPLVKQMRKHTWLRRAVAPIAVTRARFIAGETEAFGLIAGFFIRAIGEPLCWVIGHFVAERDLHELYSSEAEVANYANAY